MYFWGSYNFQAAQQAEEPTRPPLRYPMYLPPSLSYLAEEKKLASAAAFAQDVEGALHVIRQERLYVRHVACGLKHLVAIVELHKAIDVPSNNNNTNTSAPQSPYSASSPLLPSSPTTTNNSSNKERLTSVYGMGSNHHGQLGARVATYTNTLTNLRVNEVLDGAVDSVACGARHTLLCTSTGCVYVSGDNSFGQLGLTPQAMRHAQSASAARSALAAPSLPAGTRGANTGLGGSTASSNGMHSACLASFTQLTNIAHIRQVFACQNASFALDRNGQLYAWGDAQYGHLGHNDKGERLDTATLKTVTQNVTTPQLVRWFERHRVTVVQVAVGKAHVVCRSESEVYSCGEAAFGKLGHGDISPRLEPTRVVFPPRKQTERLVDIAAGDDHTLVLKDNPDLGSVVYFFGKLSNGDGQLTPAIVPAPDSSLRSVVAGKGNLCYCLSSTGRLYGWGRHSYGKVYTGGSAVAPRQRPTLVGVLSECALAGVAVGGTFVVAYATCPPPTIKEEKDSNNYNNNNKKEGEANAEDEKETRGGVCGDVMVPHDYRVNVRGDGDDSEEYELAVRTFLTLYFGEALGKAYAAGLPPATPRTAAAHYAFSHIGAHGLTRGQKVRLWMTDVYALGTVLRLHDANTNTNAATAQSQQQEANKLNGSDVADDDAQVKTEVDVDVAEEDQDRTCKAAAERPGRRVTITWERDDWKDELVTLYSSDETVDAENANRWQPYWFEQDENGEYIFTRKR